MCANLANPAPAGAARGRCAAITATLGLLARHRPPPIACGGGAAPGLSAGHGPLRAARGRGPAAAAGLRWTCGPDSSAGGQRRQPVPGGDIHSSRSANKRSVLQDVHEELQGGELHHHRWLSGGLEWTLI